MWRASGSGQSMNAGEMGHIYSHGRDGPRGRKGVADNKIDSAENLLLVCHGCHKTIDKTKTYSAEKLIEWKKAHESRVERVTGIDSSRTTFVVTYGATIGNQKIVLDTQQAFEATFSMERYPSNDIPAALGMKWEGRDDDPGYWQAEQKNLLKNYQRVVQERFEEGSEIHFSVFGLAPIPLLVQLGAHFGNKKSVDVYQLRREPQPSWVPNFESPAVDFQIKRPGGGGDVPVVVFSLSDKIARDRIKIEDDGDPAVWEVTTPNPNMDLIQNPNQLSDFRRVVRETMSEVQNRFGSEAPVHILSAMPLSTSIELGKARMPQVWAPWKMYDHGRTTRTFTHVLTIGA